MWHVSSRSSVATLRTAIHLLLTYLLTYMQTVMLTQTQHQAATCKPQGHGQAPNLQVSRTEPKCQTFKPQGPRQNFQTSKRGPRTNLQASRLRTNHQTFKPQDQGPSHSGNSRAFHFAIVLNSQKLDHHHHHHHHHGRVAGEVRRVVAPPCPRSTARLQSSPVGRRVESFRSWSTHLFRGRPGGRRHVRSGGRLSDTLMRS